MTIDLPDALVAAVEAKAAAEGRTFTDVLQEGLRAALALPALRAEPVALPAFGDPAGGFLVDPADRDATWEILEADGTG